MLSLKVIYTIWLREFKTFIRERSRMVGMVGQPLLYLLILGKGITASMNLNNAPAGMDYLRFMYPGIIGMSVLFTSIFSAMSIIWDREFGFLKEVLVAPVPRWAVAVGKVLGGATVATIQSAILIVLAPLAGISLSVWIITKIILLSFLMSFAITSLGVSIAVRMESMQGFQMIMNFLIMPLYFLSGSMFPINTAPEWMKSLMVINPLTYGVDAIRTVVFSGTVIKLGQGIEKSLLEIARQAGLVRWNLSIDILVLMAVAFVLVIVGTLSFSKAD
ncbi:ABC transporter permease [Calderihabitans maritimus]|uniref:Transport permease protein n=1 Tax=Calderihabitans maritimus TaxID=1246530 RepID=A0A1Z5HPU8_9FIRM|nr:ABC transporter permease [Calderihabitans maritimus]GAW91387.1 ABC-type polysaccharide/polyol phosphate export systems, permease component [Calderihabitans maritimus]